MGKRSGKKVHSPMAMAQENIHWMHDLRVQMQLIQGNVQLIAEAAQGSGIVFGSVDVSEFVEALQSSSSLAREMLTEHMREPVEQTLEICDVSEVAREALRSVQCYARRVGKSCVCEAEEALPVRCARLKLKRALYNLLTNALFHTPEGATIRVRATREEAEEEICLAVEDDGPGLSAGQAAILQDGVGWEGSGLHSVHRLVDEMHGRVRVGRCKDDLQSVQIFLPLR